MDASVRRVMGLISEMNVRFVVPVYQRPYSWGEEQCLQLWDDILACGRSDDLTHFTGSIVTMQDGTVSEEGVAPLSLIDGQQRITTIALLLVALARYAVRHGEERLPFSRDEIVMGGYLTNPFRSGEDHYKLTLSKGDRAIYRALVDAVEGDASGERYVPSDSAAPVDARPADAAEPTDAAPSAGSRILDNLHLFESRLEALADVSLVWAGLQRLEVVSISLAQGRDNPQLIFESMNSTGKDLAVEDLVRNYVLMKYPLDRQSDVYQTYWKPIEDVLAPVAEAGATSPAARRRGVPATQEGAFEDFLRCFFQMAYAPNPLGQADLYQTFKRYVEAGAFDRNDRMGFLCLRVKDFARYYVAAVLGTPAPLDGDAARDEALGRRLSGLAALGVGEARPLELELMRALRRRLVTREQLTQMLGVLESYLLRRSVCDCEPSAQARFLLSLLGKLAAVRDAGEDYHAAYLALFLVEEGTSRRFPGDDEFARSLRTRDCFGFGNAGYLLSALDDALAARSGEGAPAIDVDAGAWSVEHVMPVGALRNDSWQGALGPDPELAYERSVNQLGNLTLAPYDFDLQDGTLDEKRSRLDHGTRPGEGAIPLSREVLSADSWGPDQIERRSAELAELALEAWPMPRADEASLDAFRPSERAARESTVTWQDLVDAGVVQMDDALVSASPMYPGRATVTSTGKIMLATGESFTDPDEAYERFLASVGAHAQNMSGWLYWRLGEGGPLLDELRQRLQR